MARSGTWADACPTKVALVKCATFSLAQKAPVSLSSLFVHQEWSQARSSIRCFHTQISTASINANQSGSKEVSDDLSHKQRYRSSTSQPGHPKYASSFRTSDLDQNSSVIARVLAKPMPNKKPPHFCKDFSSLIYVWSVCGYRTHYPLLLCTTHPVPDVTRQTIS